jgi:hypothetical protein
VPVDDEKQDTFWQIAGGPGGMIQTSAPLEPAMDLLTQRLTEDRSD